MYKYLNFNKIYEDAAIQQTAQDLALQNGVNLNLQISAQNIANLKNEFQSVDDSLVVYAIDPNQSDAKKQSKTIKVYFDEDVPTVSMNAEAVSDSYILPLTSAQIDELASGKQLIDLILRAPDDPSKAAVADVNGQLTPVKINVAQQGIQTTAQPEMQAQPSEPMMNEPSEIPTDAELLPGIATEGKIATFDAFMAVQEAKKNKQWIKDIDMKKGALKKQLGDDDLTFADIEKAEKKLKKKDKDPKKKGLQLGKKDSTLHKRLTLAKNLMNASGVNESKSEQIAKIKNVLVEIHKAVEEAIKKTTKK
jgi:hypothetical protein